MLEAGTLGRVHAVQVGPHGVGRGRGVHGHHLGPLERLDLDGDGRTVAVDVIRALVRKPRLAQRYLAVESGRALRDNAYLLPAGLLPAIHDPGSDSPAASLAIAGSDLELPVLPADFGLIRPKDVMAAQRRAATLLDQHGAGHVPRKPAKAELEELDDGEVDEDALNEAREKAVAKYVEAKKQENLDEWREAIRNCSTPDA